MKASCILWRRRISAWVVLQPQDVGPALRRHLERCSACAAYAEEMASLAADLRQAIHVPAPSAKLEAPPVTAMRVLAKQRARPAGASLVAVGSAGLAAIAWLAWRVAAPSISPSLPPREPSSRPASVKQNTQTAGRQGPSLASSSTRQDAVPRRNAGMSAARPMVQRANQVRVPRTSPTDSRPSQTLRPRRLAPPLSRQIAQRGTVQPPTAYAWAVAARQFEQYGDYLGAAAAYRHAAEAAPHPVVLLESGRAAELGGDVSQAIAHYIRALELDAESRTNERERSNGS